MIRELFLKIIKDFLCVRSFITLGAFGLGYVMIYQGKIKPDLLVNIIDLLLGFWFGQKVGQAIATKKEGEEK